MLDWFVRVVLRPCCLEPTPVGDQWLNNVDSTSIRRKMDRFDIESTSFRQPISVWEPEVARGPPWPPSCRSGEVLYLDAGAPRGVKCRSTEICSLYHGDKVL